MRRVSLSPLMVLFVLSLGGCDHEAETPLAPSAGPDFAIGDGTSDGGNADFFFLPPLVSDPSDHPDFDPGGFDATLEPTVVICDVDHSFYTYELGFPVLNAGVPAGTAACGSAEPGMPQTFTMTDGPGGGTVFLDAEQEQYGLNWAPDLFDLDIEPLYRITVVVGAAELGFADIVYRGREKALKNLDTGEFIGLVMGRDLPVRFRVENGAVAPTWTFTGSMVVPRYDHTAAVLFTGEVLVVGGVPGSNIAELYNPSSGRFTATPNPPRFGHNSGPTATRLQDGRVLIVSGSPRPEIYDPLLGNFTATVVSPNVPRRFHTATLLQSGQVLLAAGQDVHGQTLATAEIYDPATDTFVPVGSLNQDRSGHTAILLDNGLVLIAGGFRTTSPGFGAALRSAELFDPSTGAFRTIADMGAFRLWHTQALLDDGTVLLAGNASQQSFEELFDPLSESFRPVGSLVVQRYVRENARLPDGRVLIAGGFEPFAVVTLSSAEVFDPATGQFSVTASMHEARQQHTVTLLPDGTVLVIGGFSLATGTATSSAELFR